MGDFMENLVVNTSKRISIDKFNSQVKIVGQSAIKKVVSTSAKTIISSCECAGGTLSILGKVKVDMLYLTFENSIEQATIESDFVEKQKFNYDLSDVIVFDNPVVNDVNFSSNEAICSIKHNTEIMGIYKYELSNLSAENQDIVANNLDYSMSKIVVVAEDKFAVSEQSETNLKNIKILKSNSKVIIDDANCSIDKIVVDGKILTEVLYLEGDSICNMFKEVEFKQEIAADGTIPNMKVNAHIDVISESVVYEENEDKNLIAYNYDLSVKAYILEENNYKIATDMFMISNDINIYYDYLEINNYLEMIEQSESILSQTDITSVVDFDDIIGVYEPKCEIIKIDNCDDKSQISANLHAYALYKSQTGIDKIKILKQIKFY